MFDDQSPARRTVVILQPCFLPWRGQFDLYSRADIRVFLDDVQFSRGTWYNRNKIMTPTGPAWITVPIEKRGILHTSIKDVRISTREKWGQKILGQIYGAYRKKPYFKDYYGSLRELLEREWLFVSDLARASVIWGFRQLGLEPDFLVSSELEVVADDPVERLVAICRKVGADRYLSGPAAKEYIGEGTAFRTANIEVAWMKYPDYPRYRSDDGGEMSIIDLLCEMGPSAPSCIWKDM